MSATLLAALNAFRAAEGKSPLTVWKKARHQPMLDAYQASEQKPIDYKFNEGTNSAGEPANGFETPKTELEQQVTRPSVQEQQGVALPVNPESLRPGNEALGADIRATREAWRASGANTTKKQCVMDLMSRPEGVTLKGIEDALGVTRTAARSLVADVRRVMGSAVSQLEGVYSLELPAESEEGQTEEEGE